MTAPVQKMRPRVYEMGARIREMGAPVPETGPGIHDMRARVVRDDRAEGRRAHKGEPDDRLHQGDCAKHSD